MDLVALRAAVAAERIDASVHARKQMRQRKLSIDTILESVQGLCDVIEDYPTAFPWPTCLVLSWFDDGRPLHSVWAWDGTHPVRLVTAYRPDMQPREWTPDYRVRKSLP